ncbi:MAG: hypothetical protein ACK5O1_06820 [Holosporales bacterium]|jgi:hypothetical protein
MAVAQVQNRTKAEVANNAKSTKLAYAFYVNGQVVILNLTLSQASSIEATTAEIQKKMKEDKHINIGEIGAIGRVGINDTNMDGQALGREQFLTYGVFEAGNNLFLQQKIQHLAGMASKEQPLDIQCLESLKEAIKINNKQYDALPESFKALAGAMKDVLASMQEQNVETMDELPPVEGGAVSNVINLAKIIAHGVEERTLNTMGKTSDQEFNDIFGLQRQAAYLSR